MHLLVCCRLVREVGRTMQARTEAGTDMSVAYNMSSVLLVEAAKVTLKGYEQGPCKFWKVLEILEIEFSGPGNVMENSRVV